MGGASTDGGAPTLRVGQEMGYGPDEFERALQRILVDFVRESPGPGRWIYVRPGRPGRLDVYTEERPPRRLGLLSLPVLDVTLSLRDFPPGEDRALLERLRRGLHRGGG